MQQDPSNLFQTIFSGAPNPRGNVGNIPVATVTNNTNNMKNNQSNNQSNNQQNNQSMNPHNPNQNQTFYSYMPIVGQGNNQSMNEQITQSHQQNNNQYNQYPLVPSFPNSFQNNQPLGQTLSQQLNQQVLSSPVPMSGGMMNNMNDFRMQNSYQSGQSMNPPLFMGNNPGQPMMSFATSLHNQKPPNMAQMATIQANPVAQQIPNEPASPRRNEKRGRNATETTASLRRKKHKEVEIRRRKKINSLFSELSHELECGPTDKASILLFALNMIKAVKSRYGETIDMKSLTGSSNVQIVADDIRMDASDMGFESSEEEEHAAKSAASLSKLKSEPRTMAAPVQSTPLTVQTNVGSAAASAVTSPSLTRAIFTDSSTVMSIPSSPAVNRPVPQAAQPAAQATRSVAQSAQPNTQATEQTQPAQTGSNEAGKTSETADQSDESIHPAASVLFAASQGNQTPS